MSITTFVVVLLFFVAVQSSVPRHPRTRALTLEFNVWMNKHGKTYSKDEHPIRLANYIANVDKVAALNARAKELNSTAVYALNKFADLSATELAARLGFKKSKANPRLRVHVAASAPQGPSSFDWRTKDRLTPIKDQGQCGSCWAFSCTESIETVYMIAKGISGKSMTPLAPQQVVDCDKQEYGCNGGEIISCYNYVKNAGGLEKNSDYPYHARDGTCHADKSKEIVTVTGYKHVIPDGSKDETGMANFIAANSPASIGVDAEKWSFYHSGIMKATECGHNIDHAVQVVGYDIPNGFWIVRNSWGADWGEKGYIRLQFGRDTCGITSEVTVPTV